MRMKVVFLSLACVACLVAVEVWADENYPNPNKPNIDSLPQAVKAAAAKDYPGYVLVSACSGKFTTESSDEYVVGLFQPIQGTITGIVYTTGAKGAFSRTHVAEIKSDFERPVEMMSSYTSIQCFNADEAKNLSAAVHAGEIKSNGRLETVCLAPSDADSECFRFDPKKKGFVEAGGWAN